MTSNLFNRRGYHGVVKKCAVGEYPKSWIVRYQAALFSNIGISREEVLKELKLSENTVRSRLRLIPDTLLIENRQKGRKYYLLDLDAACKLFED